MILTIERAAGLAVLLMWAALVMTQSPCERADGNIVEVCQ